MGEFRMPSLGADMASGTLVEWHVHPGDAVRRGDIVATVDTDKAAIEVEVWESGVVEELLVPEGTRVPVGAPLARLRPDGAAPPPAEAPAPVPVAAPVSEAAAPAPPPAVLTEAPAVRPRASPAARRLAARRGVEIAAVRGTGPEGAVVRADVEAAVAPPSPAHRPRVSPVAARVAEQLGVELADVAGTGAGGAITRADVERAAAARGAAPPRPAAPEAPAGDRSAAMRQAVAAAVTRSKREIPHYYLWTHVDMRRALAWMTEENSRRSAEERLLPAALVLKAVALALRKYPELNGFWTDGAFHAGEGVHLGVAVFLRGGGLVAPAILEADTKSLDVLMREMGDLVQRSRSGGLRASEMTSATVTVTSLGDRGVEGVLGVVYPPQVAIVGVGRIVERPWAEDGMLAVRPVAALTLAADHRASDGHRGSLFLEEVARLLQQPEEL
jgi:pyruvate dehydrogenase E2 component (dihydrolipoamide acetyltransferase)